MLIFLILKRKGSNCQKIKLKNVLKIRTLTEPKAYYIKKLALNYRDNRMGALDEVKTDF